MQGRQKLHITWQPGPNAAYNTTAYRAELEATARQPGKVARNNGDVTHALETAAQASSAPTTSCRTLRTRRWSRESCTAAFADGAMHGVGGHAEPPAGAHDGRAGSRHRPVEVTVNVTLLGGGFGRKSKPDYVAEAAFLSRAVGAPVKVTWSREDDLRARLLPCDRGAAPRSRLDANGKPVAWLHRSAFPSIASTFTADTVYGSAGELSQGVVDMPFDIPNVRCENGQGRGACSDRLVSLGLQHPACLCRWLVRG